MRDKEARSYNQAVIECSPDAVVGNDLDGVIIAWNPGAECLYGYTASEAVYQADHCRYSSLRAARSADDASDLLGRVRSTTGWKSTGPNMPARTASS